MLCCENKNNISPLISRLLAFIGSVREKTHQETDETGPKAHQRAVSPTERQKTGTKKEVE